jgi:hypothetical protein
MNPTMLASQTNNEDSYSGIYSHLLDAQTRLAAQNLLAAQASKEHAQNTYSFYEPN